MTKQYWADASTMNCVWLFQTRQERNTENCYNDECRHQFWLTERIFLVRDEARAHGEARPYAWGKENEGWRIYGMPCDGLMAELLGRHVDEFSDKLGYFPPDNRETETGYQARCPKCDSLLTVKRDKTKIPKNMDCDTCETPNVKIYITEEEYFKHDADGWCTVCKKGIESGKTICETCEKKEAQP